jgi:hypothetical protein
MWAMTKLDMSNCNLMAEGCKALVVGLRANQVMTELNLAGNKLSVLADHSAYDMSGVITLADTIKDMGTLTSLNLAGNRLLAEGAKIVAEVIAVTKCTPAIILAPVSCVQVFTRCI